MELRIFPIFTAINELLIKNFNFMKRVFMYATALTLTVGMSLAMTSCKGGTAEGTEGADSTKVEQPAVEETPVVEEVAPVDTTAAADTTATVADTAATVAE